MSAFEGEVKALAASNKTTSAEVRRLKEGRFTPEELQNLCHNFSPQDECAFKRGCEEYQKSLFGRGAVEEETEGWREKYSRLWDAVQSLDQWSIDLVIDKIGHS